MLQVPEVDVHDARRLVNDGAVLLDVRDPDEWSAGHAPEATHIPMRELQERLGEIPVGRQVVAVCRSGGRSARVTAFLAAQGYDAVNLTGGMEAWANAGLAMTSDGPGEPRVA